MCLSHFFFPFGRNLVNVADKRIPDNVITRKEKGKHPKTWPRHKGIDHQELQKALASPATKPLPHSESEHHFCLTFMEITA